MQQKLNEEAAENVLQDTEASDEDPHPEGPEDGIDWPDHSNKKQATGNKSNGAVPKKMPTSNQSTPRAARKGIPKHNRNNTYVRRIP